MALCLLKVIRVTGFMKGLYTDAELKSDNVKVGLGAGASCLHPASRSAPCCVFLFVTVVSHAGFTH